MVTDPQNDVPRIAVVGAGYWGINHVRNFHQLGALQTICDANPTSLQKFAENFPDVQRETDYEKVLDDPTIQGVVIATPAETHFRLAAKAIEAGKHVLVEKPLTLSVAEGERLVALANERKLTNGRALAGISSGGFAIARIYRNGRTGRFTLHLFQPLESRQNSP